MNNQILNSRFHILRPLGAGGFAETYIAEDISSPEKIQCVVKHLKPLARGNQEYISTARRLFIAEAELLGELDHSQIPKLIDYFEQNEEFYMVQELVDGKDLSLEIVPNARLSESYVINLLQDILPVLEYIHTRRRPVVHRDIKPSNIVKRKSDRKFVLIDFGAMKQIGTQTAMMHGMSSTIALGTEGYTPSEQLRGKPRPSSDLYALGMVCIQALTGLEPKNLPEDVDEEIQWQHLTSSVKSGLVHILTFMVRHNAKDRYQNASEVLIDLNQLLETGNVPSRISQMRTQQVPGVYPLTQKEELNVVPQTSGNRNLLILIAALLAIGIGYPIFGGQLTKIISQVTPTPILTPTKISDPPPTPTTTSTPTKISDPPPPSDPPPTSIPTPTKISDSPRPLDPPSTPTPELCSRTIRLRSWKGDYLHRSALPMDNPNGVGVWDTGTGNEWTVECIGTNRIKLRSWQGDYLHRPADGNRVGPWNAGIGNEWTVSYIGGNRITLMSFRGDYLHRADLPMDNPNGLGVWDTGTGNEWTVE